MVWQWILPFKTDQAVTTFSTIFKTIDIATLHRSFFLQQSKEVHGKCCSLARQGSYRAQSWACGRPISAAKMIGHRPWKSGEHFAARCGIGQPKSIYIRCLSLDSLNSCKYHWSSELSRPQDYEKIRCLYTGTASNDQVIPAGLRVDASTLVTVEIRTGNRASGASGQKTQKMGMGGLMEDGFTIFSGLIDWLGWIKQISGFTWLYYL